ncbi:MAG: hypothetical protein K2K26_03970 [Muribaculaceae bacterium]|nr:hypothetical protein [Muribaculaceae bacterium]
MTDWQERKKDLEVSVDFLFVAVLLVFASWSAYSSFMTSPPYVDTERYPVRGIDVSAHNGMMNLDAAARDGVEFIFIKASEGEDFRDNNFRLNYDKARHAGLKIGAYHFFRFDKEGVPQAINLLRAVGSRPLDLGLVIDVEEFGNAKDVEREVVGRRLRHMVDYLTLLGRRVTFYTNRKGYYDYLVEEFPGFQLWICSFNSTPISAEWTFWQHNHHGAIKGIKGDVDLNTFCGSRDDWQRFLDGAVWPYTPMTADNPSDNNQNLFELKDLPDDEG